MPALTRVAIIGPGLLGGSLALALQKFSNGHEVALWGRREKAVAEARAAGVRFATCDLAEAVAGASIIILCTPVGVMAEMVTCILESSAGARLLISDVGSVKSAPAETIAPLLAGTEHRFIGGHPMAGSEQKGMEAARADLFQGAWTILTPSGEGEPADLSALQDLWCAVGARCELMEAAAHDEVIGRLSHFPHLMASLCAEHALVDDSSYHLAGAGLRDTSRVASGDADMWAEILLENRESVLRAAREAADGLRELLDSLEENDHDRLRSFLHSAKLKRDALAAVVKAPDE